MIKKTTKKKKSPEKKKKEIAVPSLDVILRGITELYPMDPSSPGFVLSYIADKGYFYVSVVRYDAPAGERKQVLVKGTGSSVAKAVRNLYFEWRERTATAMSLIK